MEKVSSNGVAVGSVVLADALAATGELPALALVATAPIWALVAFLIAHRPPRIFKPQWLQDEEAAAESAPARWGWVDVVIFAGTAGAAILTIAGVLFLVVRQA